MWCLGALLSAPGPSMPYLLEQTESNVAQMAGIMAGFFLDFVLLKQQNIL